MAEEKTENTHSFLHNERAAFGREGFNVRAPTAVLLIAWWGESDTNERDGVSNVFGRRP